MKFLTEVARLLLFLALAVCAALAALVLLDLHLIFRYG